MSIEDNLRCPKGFKSKINRRLSKATIADRCDEQAGKFEASCRRIERQSKQIENLLKQVEELKK